MLASMYSEVPVPYQPGYICSLTPYEQIAADILCCVQHAVSVQNIGRVIGFDQRSVGWVYAQQPQVYQSSIARIRARIRDTDMPPDDIAAFLDVDISDIQDLGPGEGSPIRIDGCTISWWDASRFYSTYDKGHRPATAAGEVGLSTMAGSALWRNGHTRKRIMKRLRHLYPDRAINKPYII